MIFSGIQRSSRFILLQDLPKKKYRMKTKVKNKNDFISAYIKKKIL